MSPPVLIVDDNPVNLKLARVLLASEGYPITTAGDAAEALVQIAAIRPMLILMDLQMPGIDGLELTRRLKQDPAYRDIPIVAVTAYAMAGDADRARAAGCAEYVTKPIDATRLLAVVRRLTGGSAA